MPSKDTNSDLLKRLPIPDLNETLEKYLTRVEPLQDARQNRKTRKCVLSDENVDLMRTLHERLVQYDGQLAKDVPQSSYIEQFWYDAYLLYDASVVLNSNPFFQLQDDPTIRDTSETGSGPYGIFTGQVKRTAKLVTSILKFIREIRHGTLTKDMIRGKIPLSMDQYGKLFGSSRIPPGPGQESCHLQTDTTSHHVIVMYKSQFYWFDVLDVNNFPIFSTPEELEWNLYSIIMDNEKKPLDVDADEAPNIPFGVFTTENRRVWANIRDYVFHDSDPANWKNLKIIDSALFVICLDDVSFKNEEKDELVKSLLCGTSEIELDPTNTSRPFGVQRGTCSNRWYDKLQLIVTRNGKAGINFEHTGIDGHTVLRLATDIYTDSILSFARGVTNVVPDIFQSNDAVKPVPNKPSRANVITIPRKLEWKVDSFLLSSLHFAETRVSDVISQYEFATLDFEQYGSTHMKSTFKTSPDAFVQQIFQVAYYALYGKFETTYEPAMTKMFQNGRTEAIRSVTHESKRFVKSLFDRKPTDEERIKLLQQACAEHSRITKECSMGMGQDRHLYALYCLWNESYKDQIPLPPIFQDNSWSLLNTNVLSTSNCGNPCLASFGFGPVTANGFGIGYIIRDNSVSVVVSSRHRQTHRFLSLIEKSFLEVDHIFERHAAGISAVSAPVDDDTRRTTAKPRANSALKSEDLRFLLGGYDYFDVSVSG
ncbi:carnitine O-acetyltransferase YAT1 TDEL_0D04470 [Torulaspora delbrueckii]|uniref:Choline/carnitine acyltransferase domain-containing protein n=1 Tax=Torulaspora delbrueckii TaxID=4950 RepID=G8ZTT7_TORDE|nr:hypothetical protein TDEL_0D04470 [Torulaspora delbrueckii]CCE92031.1 hypothetical protein TDEL_0D04470 [Torulaspora delbrueckii]